MEIEFPIEFLVPGTPVSFQTKSTKSKAQWKKRVREASQAALPDDAQLDAKTRISVTLYYLPDEPMVGDVDNVIKLTIDAMCKAVFSDDNQVERVVAQKFEPGNIFKFSNPSETFSEALDGEKPLLYIRVSNDPFEELT